MRIDIWSDVACPWCYITTTRFANAVKNTGVDVDVHLHSWELNPNAPVRAPYPQGGEEQARVTKRGAREGLDFRFDRAIAVNTRVVHRLIHAAEEDSLDGQLPWDVEQALFRAHFTEGRDLSDPDVLVEIGVAAGMDRETAIQAVTDTDFAAEMDAEVTADRAEGAKLIPDTIPFFLATDGSHLSRATSTKQFEQFLLSAAENGQK